MLNHFCWGFPIPLQWHLKLSLHSMFRIENKHGCVHSTTDVTMFCLLYCQITSGNCATTIRKVRYRFE